MSSNQAGKWVVRRELLEYLHFPTGLVARWLERIEDIEVKHKDNLRVAHKTLSGDRLISLGQAAAILDLSIAQTQSILELFQNVCQFQPVLSDYSPTQTGMVNVKVNIHSLALFLVIQLFSKQSLVDKTTQRNETNKEPWPGQNGGGGANSVSSWSPTNSTENLFGDVDSGPASPKDAIRRSNSGGSSLSQKQQYKQQLQSHYSQLSSLERSFSDFIKKNIGKILQLLQDDTSRHHLSSREFDRLQVLIKEAQTDTNLLLTQSQSQTETQTEKEKGNDKNGTDKKNDGDIPTSYSASGKEQQPSQIGTEKRKSEGHQPQNLSSYVPYFANPSDFSDIPDIVKTIKGSNYVDSKVLERWLGDCLLQEQIQQQPSPSRQISMKPPSQEEAGGISRQWSLGATGERIMDRGGGLDIQGQIKSTIVKGESDVNLGDLKIIACADCHIYVLAPIKNCQIANCSECTITLGAVGGAFRVDSCERSTFNVACARILINSCHGCSLQLAVNSQPVVIGDNRITELGPYCTRYDNQRAHLQLCKIKPGVNYWNDPVEIVGANKNPGKDDGKSKQRQINQVAAMKPEDIYPFLIPFRGTTGPLCGGATSQITERLASQDKRKQIPIKGAPNYFPMPPQYDQVVKDKIHRVHKVRQALKLAVLEEQKKKDLQACIMHYYKEWLSNTGKLRLVSDLARLEKEVLQSYQNYFKNENP